MSPLRAEAMRRWPWLRKAYLHEGTVRGVLADADVASDPGIEPGGGDTLDVPDARISGQVAIDVVPETPISIQAHLDRAYITHRSQLLTYAPYDEQFANEVFGGLGAPEDG